MKKLLTILILLSLCESCGFLHKTFDRNKEKHNNSSKVTGDSSVKKSSDSTIVKTVDSSKLKKSEEKKSEGVEIVFSDSSDHNKVEISTDSTGRQVIKAEGNIKSIRTHRKQETKLVDSTHLQTRDTASKHETGTVVVKKTEETKNTGTSKDVHRKKLDFRIPWYAYLIGIVLLILTLFYLWKRYRFKIIAWFIQLRNPGTKVYYDPKIKGYQIITKQQNTS
jgi:hypothetical protein